jgi:hypothetical protein
MKVANASADLFKATHGIRGNRSTAQRLLNSDHPIDSKTDSYLRNITGVKADADAAAAAANNVKVGPNLFAKFLNVLNFYDRAAV